MAKKVYPGAAFEPCENEVLPFLFDLFAQTSLLAPLPARTKENLEKCPGAMRLRKFKRDELICRQGEEDCTAFYILKAEDIETLRSYPQRRTRQIAAELADADKKIAELKAGADKAQAEGKPKDAEKALKQLTDLEEQPVNLRDELDRLPELALKMQFLTLPAPPESGVDVLAALHAGAAADLQLQQCEQQASTSGNREQASLCYDLRTADPGKKRARAESLQRDDPELAEILRASARASELRQAAVVYLGEAPAPSRPALGWFDRLKRTITGVAANDAGQAPTSLPFDGPTEVNARTRRAILHEGELFGEMACLNRAPRSASVVAQRDCYILEMLSNILMEIDKDPGYQKERARVYEERAFDLQLRALSLFADLSDEQFARAALEVRGQLRLRSFKSGEIICDEHERSDCVYLVRGGLVQVKKNVTSLLHPRDVTSWPELLSALRSDGPAATLRTLLSADVGAMIDRSASLSPEEQAALVHGLNDVIRNPQIASLPAFKDIVARASLLERVRDYAAHHPLRQVDAREVDEVIKSASVRELKKPASAREVKLSDLDRRRLNRLLMEELVPGGLRRLPRSAGPERTLTYLSRGEFIGEMGVCRRQPRSSTCIAFGQPRNPKDEDLGAVELVQIPGEVFLRLMEQFPAIKTRVEREISTRARRDEQVLAGAAPLPSTTEADRLGLIQGQQLMLIDMERCTMCQECVKGCVDAHEDGRSRLFLVGHRYDKYLVPITCRSCLDPVCMIGCPVRSIQRGDNHEIVIKDWCIGCRLCARNCPYDAIKMHDLPAASTEDAAAFRIRDELAVVCDLCSSLPDQTPRCVYACPHEAATRVNARSALPTL